MSSISVTPVIVVFSPHPLAWTWYEQDTRGRAEWLFYNEDPKNGLERFIQRPHLARVVNAFRCVSEAIRRRAAAVAAHSRFSTFWIAVALKFYRSDIPLVACSFHFEVLPHGLRRTVMAWAYRRVQRFIVHSEIERQRYAGHFGLPVEKFDLVRWGVQPSIVDIENGPPAISGDYLCAIGKDGRDYRTLVLAMRQVPEIPLVIVAQPHNLAGVDIPPNVTVLFNVPMEQAMNVMKHSRFMALPLLTNETSCGHITIVSAMFGRKAVIVTDSIGIADYFPPNDAAPKIAAGDANAWAAALRLLWNDRDFCESCARKGQAFALRYCTHEAALENTLAVFRRVGLDLA